MNEFNKMRNNAQQNAHKMIMNAPKMRWNEQKQTDNEWSGSRSVGAVCLHEFTWYSCVYCNFFFFLCRKYASSRSTHSTKSDEQSYRKILPHTKFRSFLYMMVVLPHKNTHTFLCNIFICPGLFNGNIHSCLIIIGEKKSPRVTAQKENIYGFMRSM